MVMDFHDDEYNVEQSNGPHSCLWSSQPDSDIAFHELISSKMSPKLKAPPECHETRTTIDSSTGIQGARRAARGRPGSGEWQAGGGVKLGGLKHLGLHITRAQCSCIGLVNTL